MDLNGARQADYAYNALGQQVSRDTGWAVTLSVHDLNGNRIAEHDGSGAVLREYIWLDGRALAVVEGGQTYWLHWDHILRPVMATDSAGAVVWAASYLPFGGIDRVSVDTGALTQDLRFPGQWFQAETGLHQNWMRDYDPTTGRYLQADPLGLVDGASVYGYARQGPGRWTDVEGLKTFAVGGADLGYNPVTRVANENGWDYYRHNDQARLIKDILDFAAKHEGGGCGSSSESEEIKVVGHSWGADTAARAARVLQGKVDLLVTVDGVSESSTPHPAGIAGHWINITATRGVGYDWSDFVADLGSGGQKARQSRFRNADAQKAVPAHHAEFGYMLDASGVMPRLK